MTQTAQPAQALTINLTFDEDRSETYTDSNGLDRTHDIDPIIQAAAQYWQGIILDNHTINITYFWEDVNGGVAEMFDESTSNDRVTDAKIRFDPFLGADFYFDPTPNDNSEFSLTAKQYRSLTAMQKTDWFRGSPPGVFEVGVSGPSSVIEADGKWEAYTIALHEIGHTLGVCNQCVNASETADEDYDIDPALVGGATMAVRGVTHFPADFALMGVGTSPQGTRQLPGAADVLSMVAASGWTVDLPRKYALDNAADWHTPGNWLGNRVPDVGDDVFISPDVPAFMTLGGAAEAANVTVTGQSDLFIGSNSLLVTGDLLISGAMTTFGMSNGGHLAAGNFLINGQAAASTTDASVADAVTVDLSATLDARGPFHVGGTFYNSGLLRANSGDLTFTTDDPDVPVFDFDGTSSGRVEAISGSIVVNGTLAQIDNDGNATAGPFRGLLTVGDGRSVTFNKGWELSSAGIVALNGGAQPASIITPHLVGGVNSDISGHVNVSGPAVIDSPTVFRSTANVSLADAASSLAVDGLTDYHGGMYTGPGTLRQLGNAHVLADTTIAAGTFDWDGDELNPSTTTIDAGVTLTIDSAAIEASPATDGHDGLVQITGGSLNVNTTDPWRLDGSMSLSSGATVGTPAGGQAPMVVHGSITVSNGNNTINAPVDFQSTASVALFTSGTTLDLAGMTTYRGGSYTGGFGTLVQTGNADVAADTTIGVATYDWDGNEAAPSTTNIYGGTTLTLNVNQIDTGDPADDGHDGTILIQGGTLNVNTPQPWRVDGTLHTVASLVSTVSRIQGSAPVMIHGTVDHQSGITLFDTPVTLMPGSQVLVGIDQVRFNQTVTYAGGTIFGDGTPAFQVVEQKGDAVVTAVTDVTIPRFDWDGDDATPSNTTINPGGTLVLNVSSLEADGASPDASGYNGTVVVDGSYLEVDTPTAWRLEPGAAIEVRNDGLALGHVDGSDIISLGEIRAVGIGRIDAPLEMTDQSVVRVTNPSDTLFLSGATTYRKLAAFTGMGTLIQAGDAMVTGPTDTDGVNVGIYNWDGVENAPSNMTIDFTDPGVGVNDAFVINAAQIESGNPADDGYDGTLTLVGRILRVNTAGPWRMDGTLILTEINSALLPRIEGSEMQVYGTVVLNSEAIFRAPVSFHTGASVDLDATDVLRFQNRVTYAGGQITGTGTIIHEVGATVEGDTTIAAQVIDLDGPSEGDFGLKITNGSLTLNVNQIDTADNTFDGELVTENILTVNTPTPWTTNGEVRLAAGVSEKGTILGSDWVSNGPIIGQGGIGTATFVNNGGILADQGTLVIDTGAFPDLDGTDGTSTVQAVGGDVLVTPASPKATFAGTLTVGVGDTFSAAAAGLQNLGTINLSGRLVALQLSQESLLHTTGAVATIQAETFFTTGSSTILDTDLVLEGPAHVEPGASFSGAQTLRVASTGQLFVEGALGVDLRNEGGQVHPGGDSIGSLTLDADYTQAGGSLHVQLKGVTPGTEHDQLDVHGQAKLAGTLAIEPLEGYTPSYGDQFDVLLFGTRADNFDQVTGGLLNQVIGFAPVWGPDRLTLVTMLPGDANGDGGVSIGDLSILASAFNTQPGVGNWDLADFNGDGRITIGDLSILAGNFGLTTETAGLSSEGFGISIADAASLVGLNLSAVPEPGSALAVLLTAGSLLTRQRPRPAGPRPTPASARPPCPR